MAIAVLAATVATGGALASEIRRGSVASASLGREMPYVIYLPDGYRVDEASYPVLYLLHGAGGDENAWTSLGKVQEKADALIRTGAIPPTLIVMPGCHGCWWVDSAAGKAESAVINDLLPAIARRYRTIETREGRLVAGLSAGGYGAVRFGMRYPELFGAVAALSPAVYAETPPLHSSARKQPPFLKAGAFDQATWDRLNYPSLIDRYLARARPVPMYLVSGDNDGFGIAFETALLFKRLFGRQPHVELRVVDGDHNWKVWASAIDGAMRYLYQHAARPQSAEAVAAVPASLPLGALALGKQ